MSIQTVETILGAAEHLSLSEQLTLIQRLVDVMKKTSEKPVEQAGDLSVNQHLKQVLAKPARRQLHTLKLDTRGFQFNREEANGR